MPVKTKSRRARTIARQSQSVLRPILIWGVVAAGVIGLVVLLFLSLKEPTPIRGIFTFSRQPRGHDDTEIVAGDLPPVGGSHDNFWQNCGIYTEPIDVGNAVHSLEHGAVWITYRPDLPAEDVTYLQNLVRGERHLLLSPYPELKSPVVLTAWEVRLELDSAQDRRIPEFIDRYRQGLTTPERGATCTDGVGTPLQ